MSDSEISMENDSERYMENEIDLGVQLSTDCQEHTFRISKSWCIYKVEQNLKKVHEESMFHPKLVSIGPFHHNKYEHLKLMEKHKWRSLSDYLKSMKHHRFHRITRTGAITRMDEDMPNKKQRLVAAMKKLEAKARACYSEMTEYDDLGSNEFRMMMLLDGCFIIQLLLLFQKTGHSCRNADDPMFTWRSTLAYLRHDLLLLENQLPFFVLQELFAMSGIDKAVYRLTDLILDFFNPVLYRETMVLDGCKKQLVSSNDKAHLLELFMSSFQTTKTVHQEDHFALQVQEDDQYRYVVEDSTVSRLFSKFPHFQRRFQIQADEPQAVQCFYFPEDIVQEDDQYVVEDSTVDRLFPNFKFPNFKRIFQIRADEPQISKFEQMIPCSSFPEDIPNDAQKGHHHAQDITIHCVTELREAGIEFMKNDHHDLLHIEFNEGKLHIPTLFIDDNTVPVLLNFIAYEQRHHSIKPYFTSYLMFLDYLVNSSKDVEHLHYKGIINHGLGSDEQVATLFNKLCKEVVLDLGDDNYLSKLFAEVNQYFGKRRNRWRAAWKHEYFRIPWAFSSFLAAIVLLVLTFLQTFFTMYAYFHPRRA